MQNCLSISYFPTENKKEEGRLISFLSFYTFIFRLKYFVRLPKWNRIFRQLVAIKGAPQLPTHTYELSLKEKNHNILGFKKIIC